MAKENIIYQQQQKICRQKICGIKVFRTNLSKMFFAPPKKTACYCTPPQKNCLLLHIRFSGTEINFKPEQCSLIDRDADIEQGYS